MQWHYLIVLLQETIIKFYEQDSEANLSLKNLYFKTYKGLLPLTKLEEQGPDFPSTRKK